MSSHKNGLVVGLLCGPIAGPIVGLFSWLFFGKGGRSLVRPLSGLALGLAIGLIGVLLKVQLAERGHPAPNEGIWRSVKNVLVVGLLGGLAIGLLFILGIKKSRGLVGVVGLVLSHGLIGMLIFGLTSTLIFGLSSFVQHFLLRFFLWRINCLPWDLVPFLDEAAERLLLRKVGGSYIFVHRLLLDYFATLDESASAENTCARRAR